MEKILGVKKNLIYIAKLKAGTPIIRNVSTTKGFGNILHLNPKM
jgi:hypothetical protein